MIQRIQSVWLLLAGLFTLAILFFNIYYFTSGAPANLPGGEIRVGNDYLSLVLVVLAAVLPVVAIFMFRNRKRQIMLSLVSIFLLLAFVGVTLWRVAEAGKAATQPAVSSYGVGSILPVISIIMLALAISGIRRDDKLVKSMDRLR